MEIIPQKNYIEEITRIFHFSQEEIDFHILVESQSIDIFCAFRLFFFVEDTCFGTEK